MSWKLTKKLKETNLAPLANSFSRSPSISTIKDGPAEEMIPVASRQPSITSQCPDGISNSEALFSPPVALVNPGILIVTVHEGKGFSLSPPYQQIINSYYQNANALVRPNPSSSQSAQTAVSFTQPARSQSTSNGINAAPTIHGRYLTKYLPYAICDFDKNQVFVDAVSGTLENPLWGGNNTAFKFDVSRQAELSIQIYLRNPAARPEVGRSEDIFLGATKIQPHLQQITTYVEDPKLGKNENLRAAAEREKNLGQLGAEWLDLPFGTGSIKVGLSFVENRACSMKLEDFEFLKVVGRGSFGKVVQVIKKDTKRVYALKTLRKVHLSSRSEVTQTLVERSVLAQINNPFIIPLKFSFQSSEKLYLVLAFVNGGDLFYHLQREQRFDINRARFYTAELLCALECLHGFKVIYGDLKPENVHLDFTGHIALCDFGLCKLDMKDKDGTNNCGTPEYLAPELLLGKGCTKSVDFWTLGVLLYEMLTGLPPFYDENTNEMYKKIVEEPLKFPSHEIVPAAARDLLTGLLDRDPQRRLGANGAGEIKAHCFFSNIDWRKLLMRRYEPTFKPNVMDMSNFDEDFKRKRPKDSVVEANAVSQTMQDQFAGWSYNRPVTGFSRAGDSISE